MEMLVSIVVHVFLLVIVLLLGYVFYTGKAGFWSCGFFWKESQLDGKKVMRFTGKIMFCLAFCVGLMLISDLMEIKILYTIALILSAAILIFFVIYSSGTHFLKYK